MKKIILLLAAAGIMLCACTTNKTEERPEIPEELEEIKDDFSMLYRIMFKNENEGIIPVDLHEEEAVYTASGFSDIVKMEPGTERERYFEKIYYYFKKSLTLMESIRIELADDGTPPERIRQLDKTVNRLGHMLNINDDTEAMRAINDGIYIIGEIAEGYGESRGACVLRLEYCLNLLEIEATNEEGFAKALILTENTVNELRKSSEECAKELDLMEKGIESLKDAAIYEDAQLIRMKVEIMRANLDKISMRLSA